MATRIRCEQTVVGNRLRRTMFWLALFGLLAILFSTTPSTSAAPGYVTIVNLTDNTIYVARAVYEPGVNNSGLAFMPKSYVNFNAWYGIRPGESADFNPGYFYVMDRNHARFSWRDRVEAEIPGVINTVSAMNNVRIETWNAPEFNRTSDSLYITELRKFLNANRAYTQATYQKLRVGWYSVTGPDQRYVVRAMRFNFDFRSRDQQRHWQCYPVPGTVVDYEFTAQRRHGPVDRWTQEADRVCLTVITRGHQPRPGAARDQGYYIGGVTVLYTVPLR